MQIRKMLPRIFYALIGIPLMILAIVTYFYLSNMTIARSKNHIKQLAVVEGRALEALIEAKVYQVQMIASDQRVISVIEDKRSELGGGIVQAYLQESALLDDVYQIVIMDMAGEVLVSSGKQPVESGLPGKEEIEALKAGSICIVEVEMTVAGDEEVINVILPVRDSQGQMIGVVCEVLCKETFVEFVKSIQVGDSGYAFIIDSDGRVITHPDKALECELLPLEELRRVIDGVRVTGRGQGDYTYTYLNQNKFTSFAVIDSMGWVICVTQEIVEMRKQAYLGTGFILLLMLAWGLISSLISKRVARMITEPIDLLIETMNDTTEGMSGRYCEYQGDDEFGLLARYYNQMIKRLSESEMRYRTTLDAIEEVIWEYDVEEECFYATENWSALIECQANREAILGFLKSHMEISEREKFICLLGKCVRGEVEDFTQEVLIYMPQEKKWFICKGHASYSDRGKVDKILGIVTDITAHKYHEEEVRKLTFFDGLTGCLNKTAFVEGVESWIKEEGKHQEGVLMFIDLDDFKKINDTLSHEIGDKVLRYLGQMLREKLPSDTMIGRFGGDEFVIFKQRVAEDKEINGWIRDILSILQQQIKVEDTKLYLTCSVGVTLYPEDGRSGKVLLKNADTAMYKAKEKGKNSYSFYTPAMTQSLDRKLMVEQALREAVEQGSFYLVYQPIVEPTTGRTVGCEALIRLQDSKLGFIPPDEFIQVAEETDLIIPLGDWVLENTLDVLNELHQKGYPYFTMNINVSSIQIREKGFVEKLREIVKEKGVRASCIKIEVTESVLMEQVEESIQIFNTIKELGIQVALDDFGTGYSSLNYLRRIPLDVLKIDKSFVDEVASSRIQSEIVDSIIHMAHVLEIVVVAEGVEEANQLSVLQDKGCDYIQGYYYSKPLAKGELERRLAKEGFRED